MSFRIVTLNLEQNHKRWKKRGQLVAQELDRLKPDLVARNEVSIPATAGALVCCPGATSSYDGL